MLYGSITVQTSFIGPVSKLVFSVYWKKWGQKAGSQSWPPELIANISTEIENGSYQKVAARKCGVGERTFYAWMENAEGGVCGQFQELKEAVKNALQKNLFFNVKKKIFFIFMPGYYLRQH